MTKLAGRVSAVVVLAVSVVVWAPPPADSAITNCDGILWSGFGGGWTNLWTVNDDGTERDNITALHEDQSISDSVEAEWHPSGQQIAWSGRPLHRGQAVMVADLDGYNRQAVSSVSYVDGDNGAPKYSPDGSRVAWHGSNGTSLQIYVADRDGANRSVVSTGLLSTDNRTPVWSADGSRIAWSGNDGSTLQIMRADVDGTNRATLSTVSGGVDPTDNVDPVYSPDGTRIAWSGHDGTTHQIYVADANGTDRTIISTVTSGTDPTDNTTPAWSPDSDHIAWSGHDGTDTQIYIADADGTDRTIISTVDVGDDPGESTDPVWSPDGTQIAWTGTDWRSSQIWIADADGTNRFAVSALRNPVGASFPTWSPDATRIAWTSSNGRGRKIWVADPDGTNRINWGDIVENDDVFDMSSPRWSPDGSRIAWSADGRDFVSDADGTNRIELAEDPGWSNRSPAWSPDWARIAVRSTRSLGGDDDPVEYEIWIAKPDGTDRVTVATGTADREYRAPRPGWSPDGTRLWWLTSDGVTDQIYSTSVDGSDLVEVSTVSPGPDPVDNGRLVFSPDGSRIAWEGEVDDVRHIWVADADGTDRIRLTSAGGEVGPWSPGGDRIVWLDDDTEQWVVTDPDGGDRVVIQNSQMVNWRVSVWSPDGTQLAGTGDQPAGWEHAWVGPADGSSDATVVSRGSGPGPGHSSRSLTWRPRAADVDLVTSTWNLTPGKTATITVHATTTCTHTNLTVDLTPPDCLTNTTLTASDGTIAGNTWRIDQLNGTATATITGDVTTTPTSCTSTATITASLPAPDTILEAGTGGTIRDATTCPATTEHGFTDVPDTSFADTDIACIKGLAITTGTSPTSYSPTDFVTREQMAAFVARTWRALGNTCPTTPDHDFTDVPDTSFADTDIACIKNLAITTGTSPTTYSPTDFVTREQMAAFVARTIRANSDG